MLQWKLRALRRIPDLDINAEDIATLARLLSKSRHAVCKLMVQGGTLAWGAGGDEPVTINPLLVSPMVVERATASCLGEGFQKAVPSLSTSNIKAAARRVKAVSLVLGQDSAASNGLLSKTIVHEYEDVPNVFILLNYCVVHLLALVLRGLLDVFNLLNVAFSLALLLRQHAYYSRLTTSIVTVIAHSIDYIQVDEATALDPTIEADTRRILSMTLLREQMFVRAALHPASPQPAPAARTNQKTETLINEFLKYFNGRLAGKLCHFCLPQCPCGNKKEAIANLCKAFLDVLDQHIPKVPALNKWESLSPIVAFLSFLVLCHNIGIEAWVSEFPVATLNDLLQQAGDDERKRVHTKKLKKNTEYLSDEANLIWMTLLNCMFIPLDLLMRFLEKADHVHHESLEDCLLAKLIQEGSSPQVLTQMQLYRLLRPCSDLRFLVELWQSRQAAEMHESTWKRWSRECIKYVLHLSAGLHRRLGYMFNNFPYKTLRLATLPAGPRALLSHEVYFGRRCCQDCCFTEKLVNFASGPQELQGGELHDALVATVRVASAGIVDLERQNAFDFLVGSGDRSRPTIERVRCENLIHAWKIEHQRRGGEIHIGLTEEKVLASSLHTERTRRRAKKGRLQGLVNPYFMYLNHHIGLRTKKK